MKFYKKVYRKMPCQKSGGAYRYLVRGNTTHYIFGFAILRVSWHGMSPKKYEWFPKGVWGDKQTT